MTDLAVQLGTLFSFPGWTFMTVYRLIWASVPLFSFCLRTAAYFQWFTSSSAFFKTGWFCCAKWPKCSPVAPWVAIAVVLSVMLLTEYSQSWLKVCAVLWSWSGCRACHCCHSITSTSLFHGCLYGGQFTSVTSKMYCCSSCWCTTAFQNPPQFLLLGALCLCCFGTASISVGAELMLRSFLTKSDVPRADSWGMSLVSRLVFSYSASPGAVCC